MITITGANFHADEAVTVTYLSKSKNTVLVQDHGQRDWELQL